MIDAVKKLLYKITGNKRFLGLPFKFIYLNKQQFSNLSQIPDCMFDYINLSHVIEHIKNYEAMLENISTKLKKNGILYIEFPNFRSTRLPSMYKTLNFFDDPTHVHIHSRRDLAKKLMKLDMQILKMGTRRNIFEIIAIPAKLLIV